MTNNEPNIVHRKLINKFYEAGYITWPEAKCLLKYLDNLNTSLLNIELVAKVESREIRLTSYDPYSTYRYMFDDVVACLQICGDFSVTYHYNTNTFEVFDH